MALDGSNWQDVDLFDFQTAIEVRILVSTYVHMYTHTYCTYICTVYVHTCIYVRMYSIDVFSLSTIGEMWTRLTSRQPLKKDACTYVHVYIHTASSH